MKAATPQMCAALTQAFTPHGLQRVFFETFGRKSSPGSVCVHSGVPPEGTVPLCFEAGPHVAQVGLELSI